MRRHERQLGPFRERKTATTDLKIRKSIVLKKIEKYVSCHDFGFFEPKCNTKLQFVELEKNQPKKG